ncbi:MAG TPA: sigma-70 family RNA polymerase sigma factor [Terriglobia bacterium]|nr:sigma-70 family RNA polymerase sigma factor [Terriglobia bacterium]
MATMAQKPQTRSLPQEFEQMFRKHHELVYRAAYRVTGNAEDAEDVLQTLFLRLLRQECPPQFETSPKAYLHRAAINIALDILKSKSRNVSTDEVESYIEDGRPSPDRQRGASEIQNWLRTALAELNPRTAEMFVLRHIEGYRNAEIAKMMGTSRGTVAVMLFRARLRLQKSIRKHLGEIV